MSLKLACSKACVVAKRGLSMCTAKAVRYSVARTGDIGTHLYSTAGSRLPPARATVSDGGFGKLAMNGKEVRGSQTV